MRQALNWTFCFLKYIQPTVPYFYCMCCTQHYFICRPSDSTVSEDVWIELGLLQCFQRLLNALTTQLNLIHCILKFSKTDIFIRLYKSSSKLFPLPKSTLVMYFKTYLNYLSSISGIELWSHRLHHRARADARI